MVFLRFLFSLFIVSLAMHFAWEISQMHLYAFNGVTLSGYPEFIRTHWLAAFKSALITLALYCLVAMLVRHASWARRFNSQRLLFLIVLGALWAIGIEYQAVMVAERWAYGPAMPLLPVINTGAAPVLQMAVVPLLAIFCVRRQLNEK
jgi:hypothetical protein